jgi:hypothetical protein
VTPLRVMSISGDPVLDTLKATYQKKFPAELVEIVNIRLPPGINMRQAIRNRLLEGGIDAVLIQAYNDLAKDDLLLQLDPFMDRERFDLKPYGSKLDLGRAALHGGQADRGKWRRQRLGVLAIYARRSAERLFGC